ncbi:hypothetical protein [Thalassolituus maritimus]|uniref:Dockerin domain-containing protein n=1 Tax=Thalassolituus maritimus TaxID=484498 RepID=A0ABQ0A303_9GAMM
MKLRYTTLSALTIALSLSVHADIEEVHSVRPILHDMTAYMKDREGDLLYFTGADLQTGDALGLISFYPKNFTTAEELITLWQSSGHDLVEPLNDLLKNYPSMPASSEQQFSSDEEFKAEIDALITSDYLSIGLPTIMGSNFLFYGASESHHYFIDVTSQTITTLYRCDIASFNAGIPIDEQIEACPILEAGIGLNFGSQAARTVTNEDRLIITNAQNNTHRVYSNGSLLGGITLDAEAGELAELIDEKPLNAIFAEENGRSGLFTSTFPVKKIYTDQTTSGNVTLQFNETHYAYIEAPYRSTSYLKVCEYEEVSPQTSPWEESEEGYFNCLNGENGEEVSLLNNVMVRGGPREGFIRNFALSPDNKIATAYFGGNSTGFATPVIIDIQTSEQTYLSHHVNEALTEKFGSAYMSKVEERAMALLDEELVSNYPNLPNSLVLARLPEDITIEQYQALITEVFNRFAQQQGVYAEYLASGKITKDQIDSTGPAREEEHWYTNSLRFIGKNVLQTPVATFVFESAADVIVTGSVSLPGNNIPESGINVIMLGDTGDRIEVTSDSDGAFVLINPASETYEITFSYPEHVFECATAYTASGTLGSYELLAGDLNNDGQINSADLWRYYFRYFISGVDFDVNNDGIINSSDLAVIRENQGATQCDL